MRIIVNIIDVCLNGLRNIPSTVFNPTHSPGCDATLTQVGDAGFALFVDASGYGQAQGGSFLLNELHSACAFKLICKEESRMRGGWRG